MTLNDWLLVAATIAGPVSAVQAQKWVERAGEFRARRNSIFRTLMATRATRLSPDHVQALNLIELDFGGRGRKEEAVRSNFRIYFDHLQDPANIAHDQADNKRISDRRNELFVDLLAAMATAMNRKYDRVQLKRGAYYPQGHEDIETEQRAIRLRLAAVLAGESELAMRVTSFPFASDDADRPDGR